MKSRVPYFALVRFNLGLLPRNFFFLLVIFCFNACLPGIFAIVFRAKTWAGDASSIVTGLNAFPLMFSGLLGLQFFIREAGWAATPEGWLLPAGDFLLTRPIPRRMAYYSRMSLYFAVLLLPSLLNVGLTAVEPDLRISLYHSETQSTEGADKLALYRAQFANGRLVHDPRAGHDTFVIPFGAVWVAIWQFWLAILLALALQGATLLTLPSRIQIGLFTAICLTPMLMIMFRFREDPTAMLEDVVFFFIQHWVLIAGWTLGALALVQWLARRRIEDLEMV